VSTQESKDYARGYAAGRKRQQVDISREERFARENEKWNRAFLAALPAVINKECAIKDWSNDGYINIMKQRVRVAQIAADEAVKVMR
jgi:hypothetical protein